MRKTKQRNWPGIMADYLNGMGPGELSGKHGVSKNTLKSRIRRGGWKRERELMYEEARSRALEEVIRKGRASLEKAQEEWRQASLRIYRELVEKVRQGNDVEELNSLIVYFMTFCTMNELIYRPESPESVYRVP